MWDSLGANTSAVILLDCTEQKGNCRFYLGYEGSQGYYSPSPSPPPLPLPSPPPSQPLCSTRILYQDKARTNTHLGSGFDLNTTSGIDDALAEIQGIQDSLNCRKGVLKDGMNSKNVSSEDDDDDDQFNDDQSNGDDDVTNTPQKEKPRPRVAPRRPFLPVKTDGSVSYSDTLIMHY